MVLLEGSIAPRSLGGGAEALDEVDVGRAIAPGATTTIATENAFEGCMTVSAFPL